MNLVTTRELARHLHRAKNTTIRLSKQLNLPKQKVKNRFMFDLDGDHPVFQSIRLAKKLKLKPLMSLSEVSKYYQKSRPTIQKILQEANLLHRLNFQYVVYLHELYGKNEQLRSIQD